MTRTEAYEKAWRLAMKGDFTLVDEIYHPDYKAVDVTTGIEHNLCCVFSFIDRVYRSGSVRTTSSRPWITKDARHSPGLLATTSKASRKATPGASLPRGVTQDTWSSPLIVDCEMLSSKPRL